MESVYARRTTLTLKNKLIRTRKEELSEDFATFLRLELSSELWRLKRIKETGGNMVYIYGDMDGQHVAGIDFKDAKTRGREASDV